MENLEKKFASLKILVIGDVMIDAYIWGQVSRISPEAPVPVVQVGRTEKRLGGAANVALNLAALGANPMLCAMIGHDQSGEDLLALMQDAQLDCQGIVREKGRRTTIKSRVMAGYQHLLRLDTEDDHPISIEESKHFFSVVAPLIAIADVIIFQDYDKGVITPWLIEQVVFKAKEHKVPIVVDPKKRNFLEYKNVELFKPNLKELNEGLNQQFDKKDPNNLFKGALLLKEKLNASKIMITLSELGVFITDFKEKHHIKAHQRAINDVSGAGDTVISVAALCLALNMDLDLIASLANLAGGLVCEHLGVVPIDAKKFFEEAKYYLEK